MPSDTRPKASLRLRLTLSYVALAIVPLLLVAALTGQRSVAALKGQSEALQRAVAERVAQELTSFINSRFEEMRTFVFGSGLARLDTPAQQAMLGKLLDRGRFYQEIKLVDAGGRQLVHLSRTEVFLSAQRANVLAPLELRQAHIGKVRFDQTLREPLATMSLPVLDLRSGEPVFVLIAELRLARMWSLLGQMDMPRGVEVFVLDTERKVVAHRNPAIVLAGTHIPVPQPDRTLRLDGREFLAVSTTVERANQSLSVLTTRSKTIAYALATRALIITAIITMLAVLIATVFVVLSIRYIVKPIETLARAAHRAGKGDLDFEPEAGGHAEVGVLALAFDEMLRNLRESMREAREAHERLMRQEKLAAIGRISGELGHEIRNPLGVIANSVAVLEASVPSNDTRVRRSVERIGAQVERISNLTNDLLSFARTRAPRRGEAAVGTLVEEALVRRPPPANVVVKRCLHDAAAPMFVDRDQVLRVLENIASNAYEAMPDGGELTIRATMEKGFVCCTIGDTGRGISPEEIGQIFEPLYTTRRDGVGLGLAICKNLTEANGGRLSVESVVGQGTVFTLELPTGTIPAPATAGPVRRTSL